MPQSLPMLSVINGFVFALLPLPLVLFYARSEGDPFGLSSARHGSDRGVVWLHAGVWAVGMSALFGAAGTFANSADWNPANTAALAVGLWLVWGPRVFKMTNDYEHGSHYRVATTATTALLLVLAAVDWLVLS